MRLAAPWCSLNTSCTWQTCAERRAQCGRWAARGVGPGSSLHGHVRPGRRSLRAQQAGAGAAVLSMPAVCTLPTHLQLPGSHARVERSHTCPPPPPSPCVCSPIVWAGATAAGEATTVAGAAVARGHEEVRRAGRPKCQSPGEGLWRGWQRHALVAAPFHAVSPPSARPPPCTLRPCSWQAWPAV